MLRSADGCDFGGYWWPGRQILGDLLRLPLPGCVHISEDKQAECFAFWSVDQHVFCANDILSDGYLATWLNMSGGSIWFVFDCMDECFATCVCQSVGEWACEKGSTLLMRLSRACVIKGLCLWEAAGGYVDECHGKRCRLHTRSSACGSVWKWLPTFC